MSRIVFGLIGAGGCGREVMPFARESVAVTLGIQTADVEVYFVETWPPARAQVNGTPLVSLDEFGRMQGDKFFNVAVANGRDRAAIVEAVGASAVPVSLKAPNTTEFGPNSIGTGLIMCPYSMITCNVAIGNYFQCNMFAQVAHDCVIGNFVTFSPGARCNGRVHIGDFAFIGSNAVIRNGQSGTPLRIGNGAIVGMGAVVTRDVGEGQTVVGNPARPLVR